MFLLYLRTITWFRKATTRVFIKQDGFHRSLIDAIYKRMRRNLTVCDLSDVMKIIYWEKNERVGCNIICENLVELESQVAYVCQSLAKAS